MSNNTLTREPSPFIAVSGVPNFRQLGGYACSGPPLATSNGSPGKIQDTSSSEESWCIRPGFLFRSAQPSQITTSGIDVLTHKLNIRSIFDFRSKTEIQLVATRYPDSLLEIPGTHRNSVPVFKTGGHFSPVSLAKKYSASSEAVANTQSSFGEAKNGGFVQAYEDIARSAAETGSFHQIMKHMLQCPESPILFHCTVGKDRTGVFTALLLKLCGVPDEVIIDDYSLTTQGLGAWRDHLIQRLLQRKEAASRNEAEFIISSQPETMKSFLEDIVEVKFGGARNYFIQLCGITAEDVDEVRSLLIVPRSSEL